MSGKQTEMAQKGVSGKLAGNVQENCGKTDSEQRARSYFHPAFCAGMKLTLSEWGDDVMYCEEFNLNTLANRIDFLAVIREGAPKREDDLSAIFRTYNLFEYKSPKQELGMVSYDMMMGYMYLYKAYQKVKDEGLFTVSFVREGKPLKLMKELREKGFAIEEYANGIYHVKKTGHIDMQIVVTRELDDKYDWIKLLSDRVTEEDLIRLAKKASKLRSPQERIAAQSVLELIRKQNEDKEWFMKEVFAMAGIRDWFQEEFDEKDKVITQQGEKITEQSEKITDLSEKLQSKDEQLQDKDKIISQLKQEMESLKQQLMRSTAMF